MKIPITNQKDTVVIGLMTNIRNTQENKKYDCSDIYRNFNHMDTIFEPVIIIEI